MKKRHDQHFRVLSLIEDTLLFEVDEWRERALSRLMAEKDATVVELTKEGQASFKQKRRKGLTFFLLARPLAFGRRASRLPFARL